MKVLLVEDKVDNQIVIEDMFEFDDVGAELVVVGSAEEALRRLLEIQPILILMDIDLPGMSGVEATRRIRGDRRMAEIPIWALTAHAMKSVQDEAILAGCDDYVTKPIDATEFAERLRGFVESVHVGRAA